MSQTMLLAARSSQTVAAASRPASGPGGHGLTDLIFLPTLDAQVRKIEAEHAAVDPISDAGMVVFVREGLLRVYHGFAEGRQRLVRLVGPGQWTGLEALAGLHSTRTRVVAAEASTIVVVDAAKFVQAAASEASTARELVRQLAREAVSLTAQVTETTLLNCECQLVHALLRLSRHSAGERDGSRVTLKLTQQDLADAIGIARETVNGMLSKLAELQLIAKRRGRISFDLVQLEQWAAHLDTAGQKPVASE